MEGRTGIPYVRPIANARPSKLGSALVGTLVGLRTSFFDSNGPLVSKCELTVPFYGTTVSTFAPATRKKDPKAPVSVLVGSAPSTTSTFRTVTFASQVITLRGSAV